MRGGARLVDGRTTLLGLAGFALGFVLGWLTGYAFGIGRMHLAGLAPLVAGGAGIPAFIFACFFGSLGGLAGGLLGLWRAPRPAMPSHQQRAGAAAPPGLRVAGQHAEDHGDETHGQADRKEHSGAAPSFVTQLPVYGALALAALMLLTLGRIASRALGVGDTSSQATRVTWDQKNAIRLGGATDAETSARVLKAVYPSTRPENSAALYVRAGDDWRTALAATPLLARPTNAALLLGEAAPAPAAPASLETLTGPDPADAAADVDARRASATGGVERNVIAVGSDADYRWALPAGAYAARTGTPVLFVTRDGVPPATAGALERRHGTARIFVLGPEDAVPERVARELRHYGTVTRIEGGDYVENAVRFAEFRNAEADFGWGRTGRGNRQWSPANAVLASADLWQDGIVAAHLGRTAKAGPLLFVEKNRVPAAVDGYLWRQRPTFASTPAEGPFNSVWVVGSYDRVGYNTQAWVDYSQEIEQYMTLGDSAVSGFEALGIGWIMLSLASAIWITAHSRRRLPGVMPMMKAAWAVFALLFGPVAVALYVLSYDRWPTSEEHGMTTWQRPVWLQVISATVMMFGFDMLLMCLAVFALAVVGYPILRVDGAVFWVGTSMFLMMVFMFVAALVVMMLVFHTPMTMHERRVRSYPRAFIAGLPIMVATMTVESLGMMPAMWWAQMLYLPAMQMPTADDITMWITLLMAVAVGFVVVLPFNYWMVRRGTKVGTM